MIAMALALKPRLLIADEPTTALDVTIQAQILELMRMLRDETGAAIILITHDLGVVAELAQDVAVMYAGGSSRRPRWMRCSRAAAPYTIGLLGSIPRLHRDVERCRDRGPGARPDGAAARLPLRAALPVRHREMQAEEPPLREVLPGHHARCWYAPHCLRSKGSSSTFPCAGLFGRRAHVTPWMTCQFELAAGKRWRSSANPGAASRRPGGSCCGCSSRRRVGALRRTRLGALGERELRAARRDMQIIFQDPYSSLNPRMTVGQMLEEPLMLHGFATDGARERVAEVLELVGLAPEHARRYPHQFSGGQRQRIGIAARDRRGAEARRLRRAGVGARRLHPGAGREPASRPAATPRLAYLFIAHDLAVVKHISDRVAVMYLGRIVEIGTKRDVFDNRAIRTRTRCSRRSRSPIRARAATAWCSAATCRARGPAVGCRFRTRCPHARALCAEETRRSREAATASPAISGRKSRRPRARLAPQRPSRTSAWRACRRRSAKANVIDPRAQEDPST
jgi:ABC-type dipeptide/oligopeptide/nickel transport system ATPase component